MRIAGETGEAGRTRRVLLGGAGIGVGGALAACTMGGAQEAPSQPQRPPRSVPLTIWARSASDKLVFDQIAPLAEARLPHLAITSEATSDLYNKLIVAVAASTPPDLTVVNVPNGVPMMGQGFFLRLQPYLAKDRETDQELKSFAPAAVQAYRHKNELYAVPITAESIVLWYNADLVRQAGLTPPAEIENDPQKWNWDTLLEYARKLNRGRDHPRDTYGLYVGPGVQASWGNLVYSNGGRILNEDGSKMLLSEPPAVEGVQWCVDAMWRHDVAPQPAALRATPHRDLFTGGKLAMVWDGEFFRRNLFGPQAPQGVPFRFDLAQIPFAPRTRRRVIAFHTLGLPVLRESKTPDAAWDYIRVFVGKDAQQLITDSWGSRGGNQKTYEPWLKNNAGGGPPANYAAITKSDTLGGAYPASPYLPSNELNEPLNRLMPQIYENTLPARAGLQQIDQETNAKLEPAAKAAR